MGKITENSVTKLLTELVSVRRFPLQTAINQGVIVVCMRYLIIQTSFTICLKKSHCLEEMSLFKTDKR